MPNVGVAAAVLGAGIEAVLRKVPETIQGTVVQAVAVGVPGGEGKPVRKPLGRRGLQAVDLFAKYLWWEGRRTRCERPILFGGLRGTPDFGTINPVLPKKPRLPKKSLTLPKNSMATPRI